MIHEQGRCEPNGHGTDWKRSCSVLYSRNQVTIRSFPWSSYSLIRKLTTDIMRTTDIIRRTCDIESLSCLNASFRFKFLQDFDKQHGKRVFNKNSDSTSFQLNFKNGNQHKSKFVWFTIRFLRKSLVNKNFIIFNRTKFRWILNKRG